ncbi:MAG TPA: PEP-CTERM sorting domain-containing protein, partial [Bryobacteraceae bacterium]|nr:PEP-CTERM sorting domain-containing protein [Bryobacteraceae bacterium]
MRRIWKPCALASFLLAATAPIHADVIVNGSLSLTHFQILARGGNLTMMSPVTASAFAEALDSLGALDQNFNSADNASIAVSALTTLGSVSASASGLNFTASVSGGIHIPSLDAVASATAQTNLSGFFLVSGPGPVDVQFSATIDANQSETTDSSGVSASSEVAFTLTLDNGDQPVFYDNILPVTGPDMSAAQSFSNTLSNNDLLAPGMYGYNIGLDYEPRGQDSSVPEPSSILLLIPGGAMLLMMRRSRASLCRQRSRIWRCLAPPVLVVVLLGSSAQAKDKGENKPPRDCPVCACTAMCPAPQMRANSDAGTSISLTEGNLTETANLSSTSSAFGPTIPFQVVYNSYDADGSRAQIDTTMGYGWTHSYNTFLFSQFGSMFRYDSGGRITKYKLGPGGSFTSSTGYFETLVKNVDGSFTLTLKDQTRYTFALVPGTPFLVSGPVWRLIGIVDRNGNQTTLTYTAGNLNSITDTYGRTITLTYTAQNKLASITDPAGRVTTFQYDSTGRKLIRITDPLGNSIQYSYNILYQLSGKIDKDGRTFSYAYANGEPVAVQDSTGAFRATLSNPNNWATDLTALASTQVRVYLPSTTSVTDGRGNVWRYQYDANGYVTKTVAPDGATATYTYDPATLMVSSRTDANGHTASYQY